MIRELYRPHWRRTLLALGALLLPLSLAAGCSGASLLPSGGPAKLSAEECEGLAGQLNTLINTGATAGAFAVSIGMRQAGVPDSMAQAAIRAASHPNVARHAAQQYHEAGHAAYMAVLLAAGCGE